LELKGTDLCENLEHLLMIFQFQDVYAFVNNTQYHARFDDLTAMKVRVLPGCDAVVRYRRFGGQCGLHL